ncbi:hypothetical protein MF628_002032 [Paenibacillus polymyxa]|uniref:hypothetical protein n=1 Tax=Paenibacillus polymyxa TaxID=1406 RepID=UPI0020254E08|nr:hypothetical protein [Paenibacillus polymyxa]URJ47399.3 hypothetical protein MF628_002032 [Paenibacillus polymyxa]
MARAGGKEPVNQRKHETAWSEPLRGSIPQRVFYFSIDGSGTVKKSPKTGKCMLCNDPNPNPENTTMGASFCDTCWETMKSGDEDKLGERIAGTSV